VLIAAGAFAARRLGDLGCKLGRLGRTLDWRVHPRQMDPDWDRLHMEVRVHPRFPMLELCLSQDSRPVGWAWATLRSDGSFRWLEPPVGTDWIKERLREAAREWHKCASEGSRADSGG
jgi:hypothetical protein